MQDVPNIVRKRLNAALPDSAHPDANVLTSFAEKSLPDLERAHVFEHLARCADCRDILAFSVPEESLTQPAFKPSPTRWLTWPVLRWGVIAAGIVLVSSVGILQYRRSHTPMLAQRSDSLEVALKQEQFSPMNAPATTPKSADLHPPGTGGAKKSSLGERKGSEEALNGSAASQFSQPSDTIGGPVHKQQPYPSQTPFAPVVPTVKQPSPDRTTTAGVPNAPTTTTVEASGAAPLLDAKAQPASNDLSIASRTNDDASVALSRAKPATTPAAPAAKMASASWPRWMISSTGGLQRSFDQGQTWQDVNVAANDSSSAQLTEGFATAPADQAVVVKRSASVVTFRSVSDNGVDVWAGGNGGVLYHSVDAGVNWMRVVPSSGAATLTGDITHVEFAEPQHGTITTSTGEVWTTTDLGKTWQKH